MIRSSLTDLMDKEKQIQAVKGIMDGLQVENCYFIN